jgi:squalene synthase HpnC
VSAYPHLLPPVEFIASERAMSAACSPEQAVHYTRWLATHHYENFHVVSFLLPRRLHQDFYNVYGFCRWADDLGDEIGDKARSLELLAWWRRELRSLFAGASPQHPVFVALKETAGRHNLPVEPFDNLITAFEQDQRVTRYADWDGVFGYCVNSANPVGRLVLMLCGYRDEERFRLSDATCTALQLANFWQDVTVDLRKDRIYLPLHLFTKHGCTENQLAEGKFTPGFRGVMKEAVDKAQELFEQGLPLVGTLDRRLAVDIDLFNRGGLRILEKIRAQGYDVLRARPAITRTERVELLLRSLVRLAFHRAA